MAATAIIEHQLAYICPACTIENTVADGKHNVLLAFSPNNPDLDILIWNTEGSYFWDVGLFNDEKEIWRSQDSGYNQAGEIHTETIFINNGILEH